MEENASDIFTAVAVCGCGHDGRLGITIPNNINGNGKQTASLRMACDASEICPELVECITLIPELIADDSVVTNHTEVANNSKPLIKVSSIHVGGYHNIVCTDEGQLYGWGLNENGELGLGQPHSTTNTTISHKTYFAHPTLLPFFHELQNKSYYASMLEEEQQLPVVIDYKSKKSKNFIVDVSCGAHHSFILTREGLYATGSNEFGQLGLGHTDNVYVWTRVLPRVLSQEDKLCWECTNKQPFNQHNTNNVLETYHYCTATVMHAVITHISAGTHHSLLALHNVIVCESNLNLNGNEQCSSNLVPTNINNEERSEEKCEYVYYPTLLMACGKGDFGELGYDGKLWDTLQSKAARLQSQLTLESNSVNYFTNNYNTNNCDSSSTGETNEAEKSKMLLNFKNKWKPKVQRRPEFFSATFQCVQIPLLSRCRRVITHEMLSRYQLQQEEEKQVKVDWSGVAHEMCCNILDTESYWSVVQLCAMHLHSSVTLQRCNEQSKTSIGDDELSCNSKHMINKNALYETLHWGCYYCGAVEDLQSSHPQEENATMVHQCRDDESSCNTNNNNNNNNNCHSSETLPHMTCINAGDEIIFRYSKPLALHKAWESVIQVRGSGNLGNVDGVNLKKEDCVQINWGTLILPQVERDNCPASTPCATFTYTTHNIIGKNHFLIHTTANYDNDNNSIRDVIFGFGDNLHGQLGHAPIAHTHLCNNNINNNINDNEEDDDDIVYSPRVILATGDVIYTPTQSSQTQQGKCVKQESYVVHSICEVGTGARHSVFLLKVRKNNIPYKEDEVREWRKNVI